MFGCDVMLSEIRDLIIQGFPSRFPEAPFGSSLFRWQFRDGPAELNGLLMVWRGFENSSYANDRTITTSPNEPNAAPNAVFTGLLL